MGIRVSIPLKLRIFVRTKLKHSSLAKYPTPPLCNLHAITHLAHSLQIGILIAAGTDLAGGCNIYTIRVGTDLARCKWYASAVGMVYARQSL
jgi:hypothetical protein